MGNDIETSSANKAASVETQRFEQFVKPVPQLASLLWELGQKFGDVNIGTLICDSAHEFDQAYLRWQTVRGPRAKEVIGKSPLTTGFEGYFVGFVPDANAVIDEEAKLGQSILDLDVRRNQYARDRRHAIDKFMYEQRIPSLRVLAPLDYVFTNLLAKARMIAATSKSRDAKSENIKFRETTESLVSGLPSISYACRESDLTQAYSLPKGPKDILTSGPGESAIPIQYKDGFYLLQSIGILGNPVVLRIISNPVIRYFASSQRTYYPPKGHPNRISQDNKAYEDLIHSLHRVAPKAVEAYLK